MAIAVDATNTRIGNAETETFRFIVGTGGVTAGAIVNMGTDGVVLTDGSTAVSRPLGIAIQAGAVGETVDVAVLGPVTCVTGAAEGSSVYPVDGTAGAPSHTASTKKYSVGVAMNTTLVFVMPMYIA